MLELASLFRAKEQDQNELELGPQVAWLRGGEGKDGTEKKFAGGRANGNQR